MVLQLVWINVTNVCGGRKLHCSRVSGYDARPGNFEDRGCWVLRSHWPYTMRSGVVQLVTRSSHATWEATLASSWHSNFSVRRQRRHFMSEMVRARNCLWELNWCKTGRARGLRVSSFIRLCLSVFCGIILPISQVFLSCQLVGIENFSSQSKPTTE